MFGITRRMVISIIGYMQSDVIVCILFCVKLVSYLCGELDSYEYRNRYIVFRTVLRVEEFPVKAYSNDELTEKIDHYALAVPWPYQILY